MKEFKSIKLTIEIPVLILSRFVPKFISSSFNNLNGSVNKDNDPIKSDWIKIGNDMRRGIVKYDRSLTNK